MSPYFFAHYVYFRFSIHVISIFNVQLFLLYTPSLHPHSSNAALIINMKIGLKIWIQKNLIWILYLVASWRTVILMFRLALLEPNCFYSKTNPTFKVKIDLYVAILAGKKIPPKIICNIVIANDKTVQYYWIENTVNKSPFLQNV